MPPEAVNALGRELEHRIKTFVGVSTKVTLAPPNGIERTHDRQGPARDRQAPEN